jgi:hypothetical protein
MTSLKLAFDDDFPQQTSTDRAGAYATQPVLRYTDRGFADEGEKRYEYECGRQKIHARATPSFKAQDNPELSSQEAFLDPRGASSAGELVQSKAPASCRACQQDMCCNGDAVFCSSCNQKALEQPSQGVLGLYR